MWKWWTTPAEPRERFILLTGVSTAGLMLISSALWEGESIWIVGLAGGICALLSGAGVKLLMEGFGK